MFYGAVVVPIVRAKLAMKDRSEITRDVTQWMNLAGTIAVLVMFIDVWAAGKTARRWRWLAWLGMLLPLPFLIWMHGEMSQRMLLPGFFQTGIGSFRGWHQPYLICNTLQWLAGLVFIVMSLRTWRADDAVASG